MSCGQWARRGLRNSLSMLDFISFSLTVYLWLGRQQYIICGRSIIAIMTVIAPVMAIDTGLKWFTTCTCPRQNWIRSFPLSLLPVTCASQVMGPWPISLGPVPCSKPFGVQLELSVSDDLSFVKDVFCNNRSIDLTTFIHSLKSFQKVGWISQPHSRYVA